MSIQPPQNSPSTEKIRKEIQQTEDGFGAVIFDEEQYVETELNTEIKRAQLKTLQDNNDARKKYARHLFLATCIWASVILIIVLLAGIKEISIGRVNFSFNLSDAVLITLITTTTANFFGFFFLVIKYLFNVESKV